MAVQKKKTRPKKKTGRQFRFQLGWGGLAGVTVVCFCLFLWMFLLGIWAGQTILLPTTGTQSLQPKKQNKAGAKQIPVLTIKPDKKKTAASK